MLVFSTIEYLRWGERSLLKRKSILWITAVFLVVSIFLVACSGNKATKQDENPEKETEKPIASVPKDGGTLVYAVDSPPDGIFNVNYYKGTVDSEVIDFFDDGLITYDEELRPQPNIAKWETEDNKTYLFTFEKGVKWHNGEELTVDDWIFSIEVLADPKYEGPRYKNVQTIEGVPAYREGKADSISGLKKIDDYTIEITFDEARVNNLENVWTYPMSRKEFENVKIEDQPGSPQVRLKPIGIGPYKVSKIIPGESVELVRNEDYWQGKPHIEKVIIKVISPEIIVGELKNAALDMTEFHPSNLEEIEKLGNVEVIKAPDKTYYYIGFRLGTWDGEKNIMNEPKFQNKLLRQALITAINREEWVEAFYFGLGKVVNRPIPTAHWISADNDLLKQYEYDPEKAKELLDEAGYKDVDGDGWREDPNGEEFVIKFGHYDTGNPTFEARAKAITQYWEDVGIKTELNMIDANLYYDQLQNADPSVEAFFGGWSTGADPDPSGIWASDTILNYPRWVNNESDQLIEDALDIEIVGTDQEKRKEIYVEWQKLLNEELPLLPIAELENVMAVSKRVKGVTLDLSGKNRPHEWWIEE